jgi:predicted dehydrogenase
MRVGIVGTGFGRRVVAPVFADTPGCEVIDVVSARDQAAVDALCEDRRVDLISVHSPPFLHAAHVRGAIDTGHAVLCDKPVGMGATETARLLEYARAAGVVHLVNFEFRHDPVRRALRQLVGDGTVGTPVHVSWVHVSAGSSVPLRQFGWLFQEARGGGWVRAWASHAVDAVRWMVGEITDAESLRRLDVPTRPDADGNPQPVDVEDGLTAWLRTAPGATASFDSTFAAPASLPPRIVVQGTDAVAECIADRRVIVRGSGGTKTETEYADREGDRHLVPMRRWAEVVRDVVHGERAADGPDVPTFADGLACARVLDQLRAGPLVSA